MQLLRKKPCCAVLLNSFLPLFFGDILVSEGHKIGDFFETNGLTLSQGVKKKVAIKGFLGDSISFLHIFFSRGAHPISSPPLPKDHQPLAGLLQAPGAMVLECPVSCAKRNKPRAEELISPPPMAFPTKPQARKRSKW